MLSTSRPALPVARHAVRATSVVVGLSFLAAPLAAVPAIAEEAATPPVFTGTGTLAGDLTVGSTLTVDLSGGTWSTEPESLEYTWYASADEEFDPSEIVTEATAVSFELRSEHVGDFVAVDVVGTTADEASDSVRIEADGPVEPGAFIPGELLITGSGKVGEPLTASPSAWTPEAALTFEWLVDGAPIAGGTTGATYTPVAADLGKSVTVTATGTADGYATTTVTSLPVVVGDGALTAGSVAISGTVQVGKTVSASTSNWPSGSALTYRWYVGSTPISGATSRTYTIPSTRAGKTLHVKVTASKTGYAPVSATSAAKSVAKGAFTAPTPKISGTVRIGGTVKASRGTWTPSPSSVTYTWKVNGVRVKTGSSFTIPSKYYGKKLTLTVTGSRSGYTTKSVTSSGVVIAKEFDQAPRPTISGTARVYSTLTAKVGTWSPTPSWFSYQWKANGYSISGATGRTYKLKSADHGKKITVTVTAKRSARVTTSRTSSATASVAWPVGISTPRISSNPEPVYVKAGATVTFKVSATGGGLSYQWQRRGPDSSDTWVNLTSTSAKTATLKFTSSTSHELNTFRVIVKNLAGQKVSSAAILWVGSSYWRPMPVNQWFQLNYTVAMIGPTEQIDESTYGAPGYACPAYTDHGMAPIYGSVYYDGGSISQSAFIDKEPRDQYGCYAFTIWAYGSSVPAGARWQLLEQSSGYDWTHYVWA